MSTLRFEFNLVWKNNFRKKSRFRLGSDPDKLFPFELMLKQFRKIGKFGLIMKMAESEIGTNPNESTKKLNKRLKDVVIDMVRLEYI